MACSGSWRYTTHVFTTQDNGPFEEQASKGDLGRSLQECAVKGLECFNLLSGLLLQGSIGCLLDKELIRPSKAIVQHGTDDRALLESVT